MADKDKLTLAKEAADALSYSDKAQLTEYLKDCLSKERAKILPELEASLNKKKQQFFEGLSDFSSQVQKTGDSFLDRLSNSFNNSEGTEGKK